MTTVCEIKFDDRESDIFFPGDILRCSVVLNTVEPKNLQEISASVSGISKVQFQGWGQNSRTYTNNQIYFASKTILQNDPHGGCIELNPGIHSYNFEMQLPNVLPSSFQGKFGHTHYEVKITLARGWQFDNEFVRSFTVICPVDLNKNIEFKNPISETKTKTSYMSCFEMKSFKMNVRTPLSGYTAGQNIPVIVEVWNESQLYCYKINLKLDRHVQFLATEPCERTKYKKINVLTYELPTIPGLTNKTFMQMLYVPPTLPSSPQIFDIIRIWYTITATAMIGISNEPFQIMVPITIGTIPIRDGTEQDAQLSSSQGASAPLLTHTSNFEHSQANNKSFVDKDRNQFIKHEHFVAKNPVYNNSEEGPSHNF